MNFFETNKRGLTNFHLKTLFHCVSPKESNNNFALYYVFYHQPVYTGIVLVTLFTLFDLNCHAKIKSMPQKFCNLWTVSHFRQNYVILKIEWSPEFVTIIKNMTKPIFSQKSGDDWFRCRNHTFTNEQRKEIF